MKFTLFLTETCNLNCTYCFEGKKGDRRMNTEMIPVLIRFMKNYIKNDFIFGERNIEINFNGGEPLLEFPLLKYITKECIKKGISNFSISTNFTCINDDVLDFLVNNNFTVQLSIDGKKDAHDKFRKDYANKGSFDTVFDNIMKLQKRHPDFKSILYSIVFTPATVGQLSENIEFLVENNMCIIIPSYNALDQWDKQSIEVYQQQLKEIGNLYKNMYDMGKPFRIKLISQVIDDFIMGRGKPDCGLCKAEIGILPNGDVIPCASFINGIEYEQYKIGTIYSGVDLRKIDLFLHDDLLDLSNCMTCKLLPRCHNKCFSVNLETTGNIHTIPDSICPINKYAIFEADNIMDYLISSNNKLFFDEYKNILGGQTL